MKYFFTLIFLTLTHFLVKAQDEKPSIFKMWSRSEGIKNFVFDFEKDSVTFNFSEKDKWIASEIKSYGLTLISPNTQKGRIIAHRDSSGFEHFRTLDFENLAVDSVKIYLFPEYFPTSQQAQDVESKKLYEFKTFFTTEYLYLKKVEEKAPPLKKADYIAFLKEAQVEAKKRAASKSLNLDIKKPIDKRVEDFLYDFAQDPRYRGKIFTKTLAKAIAAHAKDDNIKKIIAGIKTNFVVKKTAETSETKDSKTAVNSNKKTETKSSSGNSPEKSKELIIKTEDRKAK